MKGREPRSPEQEDRVLTPSLARRVFWTSYYLSQGNPKLQRDLLRYVALLRPEWRLSDQAEQACLALGPSLMALINQGYHAPLNKPEERIDGFVQDDLERSLGSFAMSLESSDTASGVQRSSLQKSIVRAMIGLDWKYTQERSRFRPKPVNGSTSHPRGDSHLSFFCHYVLLAFPTGCQSFDEVFTEIREEIGGREERLLLMLEPSVIAAWWREILAAHNRNHPSQQVPPLARMSL